MLRLKTLIITFFVIGILSHSLKAQMDPFYTVEYIVEKGDTFSSILKKFVRLDSIINSKTPMIIRTIEENGHVEDWRKLESRTKLILYLTKDFIDFHKFNTYKSKQLLAEKYRKAIEKVPEKKRKKRNLPPFQSSAFYMLSSGNYTQTSSNGVTINFSQNSPYTLGYSGTYNFQKKPLSLSGSLYYSHLSTSSSDLQDSVEIPPEIGLNLYLQHDPEKLSFSYYGGIDYESFSSFNIDLLTNQDSLKVDKNKAFYLTVGLVKPFKLMNKSFLSKFSISKTLAVSSTPAEGSSTSIEDYSGFKLMAYLNYKFHKRWFAHTLVKYHSLDNSDGLNILRYGLGFGFIIN